MIMPLQSSVLIWQPDHSTEQNTNHQTLNISDYELTTNTPYIALTGELWDTCVGGLWRTVTVP